MSVTLTTITEANSTTYVDELGIKIGLTRLAGETSDNYLKRLSLATRVDTGQDYVGLLNEITLQLGLKSQRIISLVGDGSPIVNVSLAGIVLTLGNTVQTIPLVTVDVDDAWTWRQISDVIADINAGSIATATLLGNDGPTLTLANQSNVLTTIAQPIEGQNVNLGSAGILVGSEVFNISVPSYSLTVGGSLIFQQPVGVGTTITYQKQIWPYSIISSDVSIISLLDPAMKTVAQGPNGNIVYQIKEVVQAIMSQDVSYWAK